MPNKAIEVGDTVRYRGQGTVLKVTDVPKKEKYNLIVKMDDDDKDDDTDVTGLWIGYNGSGAIRVPTIEETIELILDKLSGYLDDDAPYAERAREIHALYGFDKE